MFGAGIYCSSSVIFELLLCIFAFRVAVLTTLELNLRLNARYVFVFRRALCSGMCLLRTGCVLAFSIPVLTLDVRRASKLAVGSVVGAQTVHPCKCRRDFSRRKLVLIGVAVRNTILLLSISVLSNGDPAPIAEYVSVKACVTYREHFASRQQDGHGCQLFVYW